MGEPPSLVAAARTATAEYPPGQTKALLRQPTIIVSAPRAGSNLLFENLSRIRGFWSIGGESHAIFNAFPHLRAENPGLDSGSLKREHADPETCRGVRACFLFLAQDHRGMPYLRFPAEERPPHIRLLEKTPRNALNIPFLLEVFPDARFVFLFRDPRENVASIIEAWKVGLRSNRFVTFRDLPGWDRPAWCFLLPPGWRSMIGKGLADIAAFQWASSNDIILDHLSGLAAVRWIAIGYSTLVASPGETLLRISQFAENPVTAGDLPVHTLPLSRTTLTPPAPGKWLQHEQELRRIAPMLERTEERLRRIAQPDQAPG